MKMDPQIALSLFLERRLGHFIRVCTNEGSDVDITGYNVLTGFEDKLFMFCHFISILETLEVLYSLHWLKFLKVKSDLYKKELTQCVEMLEAFVHTEEKSDINKDAGTFAKEMKRSLIASLSILKIVTLPLVVCSETLGQKLVLSIRYQFAAYNKDDTASLLKEKYLTIALQLLLKLSELNRLTVNVLFEICNLGMEVFKRNIPCFTPDLLKLIFTISSRGRRWLRWTLINTQELIIRLSRGWDNLPLASAALDDVSRLTQLVLTLVQSAASLPVDGNALASAIASNCRQAWLCALKIVSSCLGRCFGRRYPRFQYVQVAKLFIDRLVMAAREPGGAGAQLTLAAVAKTLHTLSQDNRRPARQAACSEWLMELLLTVRELHISAENGLHTLDKLILHVWRRNPHLPCGAHVTVDEEPRYWYLQAIFLDHALKSRVGEGAYQQLRRCYAAQWFCESALWDRSMGHRLKRKATHTSGRHRNIHAAYHHQFLQQVFSTAGNESFRRPPVFFFNNEDIQLIMNYFVSRGPLNANFAEYLKDVSALQGPALTVMQTALNSRKAPQRVAALDILRQCLTLTKDRQRCYSLAAPLVDDMDVAVKHSVLNIFREILLRYPLFKHIDEIYRTLVFRCQDEDVWLLLCELFSLLWRPAAPCIRCEGRPSLHGCLHGMSRLVSAAWNHDRLCLERLVAQMLASVNVPNIGWLHSIVQITLNLHSAGGGTRAEMHVCLCLLCAVASVQPDSLSPFLKLLQPALTAQLQRGDRLSVAAAEVLERVLVLVPSQSSLLVQTQRCLVEQLFMAPQSVALNCTSCLVAVACHAGDWPRLLWTCSRLLHQVLLMMICYADRDAEDFLRCLSLKMMLRHLTTVTAVLVCVDPEQETSMSQESQEHWRHLRSSVSSTGLFCLGVVELPADARSNVMTLLSLLEGPGCSGQTG